MNSKYAKIVKKAIDEVDINLDKSMPIKSSEVDALPFWKLAGPPHKVRYMYIDGREKYEDEVQGDKSKADFSAVAAGEKPLMPTRSWPKFQRCCSQISLESGYQSFLR